MWYRSPDKFSILEKLTLNPRLSSRYTVISAIHSISTAEQKQPGNTLRIILEHTEAVVWCSFTSPRRHRDILYGEHTEAAFRQRHYFV